VKRNIVALISGALFGLGLTVAQMVNPVKIIDFLDLAGDWDPSLLFVMGGGVFVTLVSFRLILRRPNPLLAVRFELPRSTAIDRRVLIGSAIFGLGWGLAGYCPGPAIASLSFGSHEPWLFLIAMAAGQYAYGRMARDAAATATEFIDG
jgi:hypothetical protein